MDFRIDVPPGSADQWREEHEALLDAKMAELNARMGLREKSRAVVDGVIRITLERIPTEEPRWMPLPR